MIDYTEKIANFNLIVGNQHEDIAYKYLSKTGWDENKAANLFNEETKKFDKALSKYMKHKERKEKMSPKNINIYSEYSIDSINNFFNTLSNMFKKDNIQYTNRYFSSFHNVIKQYNEFISKLKLTSKPGVIMLYSANNLRILKNQIKSILAEPLSKELFLDNSFIYPAVDSSSEGDNFIGELNINKLPSFIICRYKNEESLAIIGKLNIPFKLGDFRDKILEAELAYLQRPQKEKNNSNKNNNNNDVNNNQNKENKEYEPNYADYDFGDEEENLSPDILNNLNNFEGSKSIKMTDGQFLAYQELKLHELEKLEEKKNLENEKEQKNKEMIEKENEESQKYKNNLRPEPEDSNPDKCIILFRFPDGEKTVQRKFLKTDKILMLYEFIKSLGREIFMEEDNHHFSLLQTFPYKLFDDIQEHTLEEEGLFPNSVLQIKEFD